MDSRPRTNIAFAGLTAAGKTTHARILADHLGYKYVSATEIMLDILGLQASDPKKVWFHHMDEIEKARIGDAIDEELEARLLTRAASEDGLVLDTWAMPWICPDPLIKIWIESDGPSRQRKCFVSQGMAPKVSLEGCVDLIDRKDTTTREIFLRRHGFDLFSDHGVFDAILTNTHMIDEPSRSAADKGIETFEPVVRITAEYLLSDRSDGSREFLEARLAALGAIQSLGLLHLRKQ